DPGRLAERVEILAEGRERMRHVEVVDVDEVAAPGVEEDELAEREELQGAAESRPDPARGLRYPAQAAEVPREEGHHAVALTEGEAPDHHGRRSAQGHVRTSAGSRTRAAHARPSASCAAPARAARERP